ncbi:hypothetical protein BFR04_00520 [Gaetbulibacter sp. 4G1]|nr:hypothetical protein [Gaetbulibacter sp. 4G1]PIA79369.1 hypothetical protein BFR04_00520 [Gaetbulibacter sp. 4G1]
MKKYTFFLLVIGMFTSCSKENNSSNECETKLTFKYDSLSGECKNCDGEIGFNVFNLDQIRTTKNAECMKFPEMHLVFILDTMNIEDFGEYDYNEIKEYNFKGANLNSTGLYFNSLIKCDFEGTKMAKMDAGYAVINGKIDNYTEFLEGCPIESDSINCLK